MDFPRSDIQQYYPHFFGPFYPKPDGGSNTNLAWESGTPPNGNWPLETKRTSALFSKEGREVLRLPGSPPPLPPPPPPSHTYQPAASASPSLSCASPSSPPPPLCARVRDVGSPVRTCTWESASEYPLPAPRSILGDRQTRRKQGTGSKEGASVSSNLGRVTYRGTEEGRHKYHDGDEGSVGGVGSGGEKRNLTARPLFRPFVVLQSEAVGPKSWGKTCCCCEVTTMQ